MSSDAAAVGVCVVLAVGAYWWAEWWSKRSVDRTVREWTGSSEPNTPRSVFPVSDPEVLSVEVREMWACRLILTDRHWVHVRLREEAFEDPEHLVAWLVREAFISMPEASSGAEDRRLPLAGESEPFSAVTSRNLTISPRELELTDDDLRSWRQNPNAIRTGLDGIVSRYCVIPRYTNGSYMDGPAIAFDRRVKAERFASRCAVENPGVSYDVFRKELFRRSVSETRPISSYG